jgi:hypothetical protein
MQVWFWLSITINLGFLGVFKYYNFFVSSFAEAMAGISLQVHPGTISLILPVGISFYTFHGLSCVIDVYKDRIRAERDSIDSASCGISGIRKFARNQEDMGRSYLPIFNFQNRYTGFSGNHCKPEVGSKSRKEADCISARLICSLNF